MLTKSQAFHDERAPGELGSRLSSDVIKLGDVLSLNINIVLRQAVQTAGGMLYMYRLHPALAGVLLLGQISFDVDDTGDDVALSAAKARPFSDAAEPAPRALAHAASASRLPRSTWTSGATRTARRRAPSSCLT